MGRHPQLPQSIDEFSSTHQTRCVDRLNLPIAVPPDA
jgi:hypothetical protein